jgi:hypothetical protein
MKMVKSHYMILKFATYLLYSRQFGTIICTVLQTNSTGLKDYDKSLYLWPNVFQQGYKTRTIKWRKHIFFQQMVLGNNIYKRESLDPYLTKYTHKKST